MSYDIGSCVNSSANWVTSSPIIKGIVQNPFFTALVITVLTIIIFMANYRVKKEGTKKVVRVFIYIFLSVTAVMYVHNYIIIQQTHEAHSTQGVRDVFAGIEQSRKIGGDSLMPLENDYADLFNNDAKLNTALPQRNTVLPLDMALPQSDLNIMDVVVGRPANTFQ